jgi:hypothetical protein
MTGLKKLAIFWLAAMLLLGVSLLTIPTTAKAQNIGTYTEQSTGNTKQALGVVVIPGTTERWLRYSPPTGGITNSTTGVTVFPAVSNRVIHVMGGQCYSDALGAATDLELRDGAGGAVIWRIRIPTAGIPQAKDFKFNPPLRITNNTLLEMATTTASVTGGVYCNWQGYAGS